MAEHSHFTEVETGLELNLFALIRDACPNSDRLNPGGFVPCQG